MPAANVVGPLAAEEDEHGEHAAMVLRARGQVELGEDARHVLLDGAERDLLGERMFLAFCNSRKGVVTPAQWC